MDSTPVPPPAPISRKRSSSFTLRTLGEGSRLNVHAQLPSYGSVEPPSQDGGVMDSKARQRRLIVAGLKMAVLFVVSTAALAGILWLALPTLDEEDRPLLHVPRTFEQLQELNTLLKKYRSLYPYRIVLCFVIIYLFLQAFSLPGSMYMSILAGAVWGPPRAIPLCCSCVACGATLCYFIGAALGPALLALPSWKARLDKWATQIDSQRANLIPFLIVVRIAPFPPHWVINVLCPHLGVGLVPFFISTWLGVMGVTVIHTSIGGGLDQMTSAADFHLISWRNFFGLSAVVVAVLIPVGIRWFFRGTIAQVAAVEAEAQEEAGLLSEEQQHQPQVVEVDVDNKGKVPVWRDERRVYADDDVESNVSSEGVSHAAKGKGVNNNRKSVTEWLFGRDDSDQGTLQDAGSSPSSSSYGNDEPLPRPPKILGAGPDQANGGGVEKRGVGADVSPGDVKHHHAG